MKIYDKYMKNIKRNVTYLLPASGKHLNAYDIKDIY